MKLPDCLTTPELESEAVGLLRTYYGPRSDGRKLFAGRHFDTWLPGDPDEFTAEDVLALRFLSVNVPLRAMRELLEPDNRFNEQLADIDSAKDFWEAEPDEESPQWKLYELLRREDGIGPAITSKLLARKRPHLVPIRDSVVARELGLGNDFWKPLFEISKDNGLKERLESIKARAHSADVALPDDLALLRVFDVVVWMSGRTAKAKTPTQLKRAKDAHEP
ncbi:DUF6308 family protein [Ammonicoccus fulvus]|uniref:DUF6308 family protein n=1 Tax=Ammonicoccus fulvus TaxID=3138240 RepID=A0ABZ3FJZ1_9ACTN